MDSKVNYAAVGVFVIGLGMVLVAAILWLAAGGELHKKTDLYQFRNELRWNDAYYQINR